MDVTPDHQVQLERIGESDAFGWIVLELLERAGWFVHVTAPFGGQIDAAGTRGVMIIAAHPALDELDLRIIGRTVADCAQQLVVECGRYALKIANAEARRRAAA